MNRLERFVVDHLVASAAEVFQSSPAEVDEERSELVEAALGAERSYRAQLSNTALRREIGDADHDELIAALHADWRDKQALADAARPAALVSSAPSEVSLAQYVETLREEGDVDGLRRVLESAIDAVFIRPAASRARNLPVGDRVRVVFRGEVDGLDLPQRGKRFAPRAFTW